MIAINFTTARGRLKDFCDRVTDRGETVIVTRKAEKKCGDHQRGTVLEKVLCLTASVL